MSLHLLHISLYLFLTLTKGNRLGPGPGSEDALRFWPLNRVYQKTCVATSIKALTEKSKKNKNYFPAKLVLLNIDSANEILVILILCIQIEIFLC